jgi:hypothetical protein
VEIPNAPTYFSNPDFSGIPAADFKRYILSNGRVSDFFAPCNQTENLRFSVQINGVQYPTSHYDLSQFPNVRETGYCDVPIRNISTAATPEAELGLGLGLPFLRSVYTCVFPLRIEYKLPNKFCSRAIRYPTDGCPGFIGFAFPANYDLPSEITSQSPTSTHPEVAANPHCFNFEKPNSGPVTAPTPRKPGMSQDTFSLWGVEGNQIPLINADLLGPPRQR